MDIGCSSQSTSGLKRVRSLDDVAVRDLSSDEWNDINNAVVNPWLTQKRKKSKGRQKGKVVVIKSSNSTVEANADSDTCVKCKLICPADRSLQCAFCDDCFHAKCGGLDPVFVSKNKQIIQSMGWSCLNCRADIRKLLGSSRAGMVLPLVAGSSSSSIATVGDGIINASVSDPVARSEPTRNLTNYQEVERVVRKTVKDAQRRKCNVVVSGLAEIDDRDDGKMFTDLCANHLNQKPRIASNGTRRLGTRHTSVTSKPRRLLVHLESEHVASELLRAARSLRNSSDDHISRNVYFNPDIAPEEEKAAFEKRQARRLNMEISTSSRAADPLAAAATRTTSNHTYWNSARPGSRREVARPNPNLIDCSSSASAPVPASLADLAGSTFNNSGPSSSTAMDYNLAYPVLVAPVQPSPGSSQAVSFNPSPAEVRSPPTAALSISLIPSSQGNSAGVNPPQATLQAGNNVAAVPFVPSAASVGS
jgi:hypothetical protein